MILCQIKLAIGILFSTYSIVGFWVVTEYVKGMYVIYELIIEEWYINTLKLKWLSIVYLSKIHDSYTYLSTALHLVYFESIQMAVLFSTLLLIVERNYQHKCR